MKKYLYLVGIAIFIIGSFFVSINTAKAVATITPASGGSNISADTVGDSYTTLAGPILAESANAQIKSNKGHAVITLIAPMGFEFDSSSPATITLIGNATPANNINNLASGTIVTLNTTASEITFAITAQSESSANTLIWGNVRVRPIGGTPLVSGNLVLSSTGMILTAVEGVSLLPAKVGVLTEVAGALHSIVISPSVASLVVDETTQSLTATKLDQFGNSVMATLAWASDHPEFATVDQFGMATPINAGTTHLTALSGNIISNTSVITVTASPTFILGCMDPTATNYNPSVNQDDGSCVYLPAPVQYTLVYTAGTNGSLTGISPQTVNAGADGSAVTAIPADNYHFVNWSDESTINPRTDISVVGDISVTANFAQNTTKTLTTSNEDIKTTTTIEGEVTFDIPASTVVTGPVDWDGAITPPTVTITYATPNPDSGFTSAIPVIALEIGAGDTPLTFDKAVKITFTGQAGNYVGWSRGGAFTAITATCDGSQDQTWADANLGAGADCKFNSENDLIVWTKHFTVFVTYTQATSSTASGNNGLGSSGGHPPTPPATPILALAPTTPPGRVLGAEKFNFTKNMKLDSIGNEVLELHTRLLAEGYYKDIIDEQFGNKLQAAVKEYQKANPPLKVDGIVGPKTRAMLNK